MGSLRCYLFHIKRSIRLVSGKLLSLADDVQCVIDVSLLISGTFHVHRSNL